EPPRPAFAAFRVPAVPAGYGSGQIVGHGHGPGAGIHLDAAPVVASTQLVVRGDITTGDLTMFGPVVLLGVGLGGATILGIPWSAHAFFTGMILLAVVLAIGPRWN